MVVEVVAAVSRAVVVAVGVAVAVVLVTSF